ncbi:MAG: hypothetical protein AAB019_09660 [Planctomycetota bacterium]
MLLSKKTQKINRIFPITYLVFLIGLTGSGWPFIFGENPNKVLLKTDLKKDSQQTVFYELEAEAEVTIPMYLKHAPMKLYSRLQRETKQTILAVEKNNITKVRREYVSSKIFLRKNNPQPRPDPLDQKNLTIEEKDNQINITGVISPHLQSTIFPNENNYALFLPGKPVVVGEQWSVPEADVLEILNFAGSKQRQVYHNCTEIGIKARFEKGTMSCTFKEIKKLEAADYAVIEMQGTLAGEDNGLNVEITLTGEGLFNIRLKKIIKVELKGDIKMAGDQPCLLPGQTTQVTGGGTLSFKIEFK